LRSERIVGCAVTVLALVVSSLGCSISVDSSRVQCTTTADCTVRGGAFAGSVCSSDHVCQTDPTWACLLTKRQPSSQPAPFTVTIGRIIDVVSFESVPGATARLCRKLDVACELPLSSQSVDPATGVTFSIDANFTGYVEVTVPGFQTTLYFFNPPVDRNLTVPMVTVASTLAYTSLLGALGTAPSTTRGTIIVMSTDCLNNPAAGISYSTPDGDAQSKSFYYVNGLPSASATATDSAGYGGLTNLLAGAVTFNARQVSTGINFTPISLVVRGGALSFTQMVPFSN